MFFGEHAPPHFHAEYGEFKASVGIRELSHPRWGAAQAGRGIGARLGRSRGTYLSYLSCFRANISVRIGLSAKSASPLRAANTTPESVMWSFLTRSIPW
ncbi:DUF4160 domain-containing protein [Geomonas sp.]|uniref:DUF4160 domain-containing protein n=1 Tax=Geomonas sp. TaxID=2651584 RepID=UPI0032C23277